MMSFTQGKTHLGCGGQCPLCVSSTWINSSIVQNTNIKTDAIFSELKTCRAKDGLAGYQSTIEEYVASVRGDSPNDTQSRGGVHASLDKSAVSSLWDKVRGVIEYSNAIATPLLNLLVLSRKIDYHHLLPALPHHWI